MKRHLTLCYLPPSTWGLGTAALTLILLPHFTETHPDTCRRNCCVRARAGEKEKTILVLGHTQAPVSRCVRAGKQARKKRNLKRALLYLTYVTFS